MGSLFFFYFFFFYLFFFCYSPFKHQRSPWFPREPQHRRQLKIFLVRIYSLDKLKKKKHTDSADVYGRSASVATLEILGTLGKLGRVLVVSECL